MSAATKLPAPRLPWPRGRRTAFQRREVDRLVHGKLGTLREQIGDLEPSLPVGMGAILRSLLERIEQLEAAKAARP